MQQAMRAPLLSCRLGIAPPALPGGCGMQGSSRQSSSETMLQRTLAGHPIVLRIAVVDRALLVPGQGAKAGGAPARQHPRGAAFKTRIGRLTAGADANIALQHRCANTALQHRSILRTRCSGSCCVRSRCTGRATGPRRCTAENEVGGARRSRGGASGGKRMPGSGRGGAGRGTPPLSPTLLPNPLPSPPWRSRRWHRCEHNRWRRCRKCRSPGCRGQGRASVQTPSTRRPGWDRCRLCRRRLSLAHTLQRRGAQEEAEKVSSSAWVAGSALQRMELQQQPQAAAEVG